MVTTVLVLRDDGLLALDLGVAHLLAVGTLDPGVVPRERALTTLMTLSIAISANNLARIGTVLLAMAFFTAVVASSTPTTTLGAVTREMAN